MTREKAKIIINEKFIRSYMFGDISNLIDNIYDGFESRICENCKWYKDIDKSYKVCKLYDIAHGKDFGCNEFIRKANECN